MLEILEWPMALSLFLFSLVFIHELGHFVIAKILGFNVTEFSIGLGPKVIKFKKNGITYALSLFPIGGKVAIKGENPNESKDEEGDFHHAQPIKKLSVALAGPLSNIAMTLFIFFGLAFTSAQLKNKSYDYRVQKSIQFSYDSTIDWSKKIGKGITSLFIKEAKATEQASLSGPLVLTKLAVDTYKVSFRIFLEFLAVISLNLAVINLLPIPLLDGGHIFLGIFETLSKRRIPLKIHAIANRIGMYLILSLTVTAVGQDLYHFFQ
ncbi:MAG: site-2 protease family protein [Bacteriovoracaceae bacterium]|nr:site-2 protease family protein [Bacteriovoracaceae bacterium]